MTGMIECRQKTKPQKISGPKINPQKISCPISETGFMKQMQCNALNIKTTAKQVWLYFHGHYHESSDCFEYPKKPLNRATQRNTCQIFLPKKIPESKISNPKKILQSSPSLEIWSTTLGVVNLVEVVAL